MRGQTAPYRSIFFPITAGLSSQNFPEVKPGPEHYSIRDTLSLHSPAVLGFYFEQRKPM